MRKTNKQINLLKNAPKSYGGELLKTRKGRSTPRPLDTRNSMHLVLRSSQAKGNMSMGNPANRRRINLIVKKFALKYGVRIISLANVGNHLHFHIKLSNRFGYKPFIRAVTAAIAMAITGYNRWRRPVGGNKIRFWDYRPFSRVVQSLRGFLNLRDYIKINQLEGYGVERSRAFYLVKSNPKIALKVTGFG